MPRIRGLSFALICFDFLTIGSANYAIDAPRTLSRPKRYLVFPEGSNVQLVFCLTVGTYPNPNDVVMGLTAALAWELPSKVDSKLSKLLDRRSRSVVFPKIEALLQSTGLDGRACVMKALCEAAQRDPKNLGKGTLIQELLHAIFTVWMGNEAMKTYNNYIINIQRNIHFNMKPGIELRRRWIPCVRFDGRLPRDGGRFERSEDQAYEHAYSSRENCGQLYPTCRHSIYELEF